MPQRHASAACLGSPCPGAARRNIASSRRAGASAGTWIGYQKLRASVAGECAAGHRGIGDGVLLQSRHKTVLRLVVDKGAVAHERGAAIVLRHGAGIAGAAPADESAAACR